jgi:hypothetical protein
MFNFGIKALYARMGKPMPCNPFKRRVTIVYKSEWLYGTYAFTFKAGERNLYDRWMSEIVDLMQDLPAQNYNNVRANPGLTILEIY